MKGSRALLDAEIALVVQELDQGPFKRRNIALFLLGVRTGFRISELLSIRIGVISKNGLVFDSVRVARESMKKKLESRTVPLHPEAKVAVLELIEISGSDPEAFLFQSREGGALSRKHAWRILTDAFRKVGLTGRLGSHCMRKTFAKRVHEKLGRDLLKTQKAMGHKSVDSTVSYLAVVEEEIDEAILKS